MNIRKAIKKIAAVGAGALLVGSSLLGASAATLEGFPQPFVTADGQGDVQFVIGNGATDDYLGALDIAVALQASAVSEETVNVPGAGTTVTVEGGAKIASSSSELNYGEVLNGPTEKLDADDLPKLLADGKVVDDNEEKEEYDYEQDIELGDTAAVAFGIPDNDVFDMPVVYINLDGKVAYEVVVDMKDDLLVTSDGDDGEGLDDSETIDIAGKSFTFKNDIGNSDDLTLYGSDTTTYLDLSQPVTIDVDSKAYTLEIVGADSEGNDNTIILDINGVRKTVEEGDSTTINGLEVFIKDLFVTNIPVLSASANIFVGSQEVTIPIGARNDWDDVEVNGQKLDGVEVMVTGNAGDWDAVSEIRFRVTPSDFEDEIDYLVAGDSFVDPLFKTFEFLFEGPSIAEDSDAKEMTELKRSGSKYTLTFTNEDGDEYELTLAEEESDDLHVGDDLGSDTTSVVIAANTNIGEDDIFIVSEGTNENEVTKIYQVVTVDDDEDEVTFEDLSSGKEIKVSAGDQLEDTGYYVYEDASAGDVDIDGETFELGNAAGDAGLATLGYIVTENDVKITFADIAADAMTVTVDEDTATDIADEVDGATFTFVIGLDEGTTGDIAITTDIASTGTIDADPGRFEVVSDDDGNYKYGLTEQGMFVKQEVDNDGDELVIYAPSSEVYYNVFIAPVGASAVVTGSDGSSVTTQKVNELAVGIAVRDTEVNLANPAKNLIVVGGTCINSVAAELKGVAAGTCGTDSGLNPNEAIIELFDLDNGKVAMLVAGWEATETQAAARAVATQDSALSGTSAKLTVTSATNYQIVN